MKQYSFKLVANVTLTAEAPLLRSWNSLSPAHLGPQNRPDGCWRSKCQLSTGTAHPGPGGCTAGQGSESTGQTKHPCFTSLSFFLSASVWLSTRGSVHLSLHSVKACRHGERLQHSHAYSRCLRFMTVILRVMLFRWPIVRNSISASKGTPSSLYKT